MSFEPQGIPLGGERHLAGLGPLDSMNEEPEPKVSKIVHQPQDTARLNKCDSSVLRPATKHPSYSSSVCGSKWFLHDT